MRSSAGALTVALSYVVMATAWILFSDSLLQLVDPALQTLKASTYFGGTGWDKVYTVELGTEISTFLAVRMRVTKVVRSMTLPSAPATLTQSPTLKARV